MPIKIAIVSPSRRQGETTVSILLALALAEATKKRVCITATGADSLSMRTMLGLSEADDITRSVSQLNHLIESGSLDNIGIKDYLTPVNPYVDVLISSAIGMSEIEGDRLFGNAVSLLEHDFIVTDVNSAVDAKVSFDIYNTYDLVLIVLSQDAIVKKKLQMWKKSGAFPDTDKITYLINGFDPIVSDARAIAKELGVRFDTKVGKMNMNPWIRKQSNDGKVTQLMKFIIEADSRVIDINYDLGDLVAMIGNNLLFQYEWGK